MTQQTFLNLPRLEVSPEPPYDPLQAFVRENHIALEGSGSRHVCRHGEIRAAEHSLPDHRSDGNNELDDPDDFGNRAGIPACL